MPPGARGRRALVEVGNRLEVVWKARLAQHLGTFTLEPVAQPAARLLDRPLELAGLNPAVSKVMSLTQMDSVFTIHPTLDAALADQAM